MVRYLPFLLQRKLKATLCLFLLMVVLIHIVMDFVPSADYTSCTCLSKATSTLDHLSSSSILAAQNKLNLRNLQDFNSSNSSLEKGFHSTEGVSQVGGLSNVALQDVNIKQQETKEKPSQKIKSKLSALFHHPLYKIPIPKVARKDKLFGIKPKMNLFIQSSEER